MQNNMSKRKRNDGWEQNGFEDWGGYMAAKMAKLEEQFHKEANKEFLNASTLFQGVAIFVNGYTDPTADVLRRLMMEHGGTYHHYLRPNVTTHIIASNLPYSKIVQYRKCQTSLPLCKPEWITDSIKARKLLNFKKYLLYTNYTETQPQLNFKIDERKKTLNTALFRTDTSRNTNNLIKNNDDKDQTNPLPTIHSINHEKMNTSDKLDVIKSVNTRNPMHSTNNSEFLSEFYSNSRLHHIATMGATFKDYVNELRDNNNGEFPGLKQLIKLKESRPGPSTRYESDSEEEVTWYREKNVTNANEGSVIMHIDMDCFFVSVGLRNRPDLKGLPVAVTHAKGNKNLTMNKLEIPTNNDQNKEQGSLSEVASCSYEARQAGVRNGMFLGQALKLCPNLQTIQYDFEGYKEVSYILYDTVASYTLDIEAVSCDEMYVDCSNILKKSNLTPLEFAKIIREEIKQKTNCPVSTGFGNNKLLARLATKKAKPNSQFYLKLSDAVTHISRMNVKDLPGVGYTTAQKLNEMNINMCAELQKISQQILQKEFGKKLGETLYNMCRGIDNSKLCLEHVRKSLSAEVNYGIRFKNNGDAVEFLKKLSEEVCNRLQKANAKGRCITLKLMVRAKEAPKETDKFMGHGLCDYITKSKNVITPVADLAIITKEVISIWNQLHQVAEDIRGIGIQISRLEISKHKSKNVDIMSFVKQSKQNKELELANKRSALSIQTVANNKTNGLVQISKHTKNEVINTESQDNHNLINNKNSSFHTVPEKSKNHIPMNNTSSTKIDTEETVLQKYGTISNPPNDIKYLSKEIGGLECKHELYKSLPVGNNTVSESESEIMVLSQDIDISVFNELPKDIRDELVNMKVRNKSPFGIKCIETLNQKQIQQKECINPSESCKQSQNGDIQTKSPLIFETSSLQKYEKQKECDVSPSSINVAKCLEEKHQNEITAESQISSEICNDFEILLTSQDVDTSILNELPNDIKIKIIDAVAKKKYNSLEGKNKRLVKKKQACQEDFFKHVKLNSAKPKKVDIPPIQEIDMSVLNELPEAIRNDILNEYSSNRNQSIINSSTSHKDKEEQNSNTLSVINKESHCEENINDGNISFSQVDPEFLNALSDDLRKDVQIYCMAKKKEMEFKKKQITHKDVLGKNVSVNRKRILTTDRRTRKPSKAKCNSKNVKITTNKDNNKNSIKLTSNIREHNNDDKHNNDKIMPTITYFGNCKEGFNDVNINEAEAIVSHNRSIIHDNDNDNDNDNIINEEANKYEKVLVNLVNHLFTLPIEQVKMQIQTWIAMSKTVNQVDFLSLATFLSMLPGKKRIEDLHILLKTMHRCMTKTGSCIWHKTYRKTVKHVQQYMQIEYNSNLMVPSIRCNFLKCNNDDVI